MSPVAPAHLRRTRVCCSQHLAPLRRMVGSESREAEGCERGCLCGRSRPAHRWCRECHQPRAGVGDSRRLPSGVRTHRVGCDCRAGVGRGTRRPGGDLHGSASRRAVSHGQGHLRRRLPRVNRHHRKRQPRPDPLTTTIVSDVAEGSASASWASSPGNRRSMQGNRSRDTKPELAVRSAVHRRGIRFRVSVRPEPELSRTADLVLRRSRIAVFVDGCFWHGCPDHHTQPATNSEYWADKIARNVERDAETTAYLRRAGWTVLRFWEHEDPESVADSSEPGDTRPAVLHHLPQHRLCGEIASARQSTDRNREPNNDTTL